MEGTPTRGGGGRCEKHGGAMGAPHQRRKKGAPGGETRRRWHLHVQREMGVYLGWSSGDGGHRKPVHDGGLLFLTLDDGDR
jgi:hypothetical protein